MEINPNQIENTSLLLNILDKARLLLFKSVYLMLREEESNTLIVAAFNFYSFHSMTLFIMSGKTPRLPSYSTEYWGNYQFFSIISYFIISPLIDSYERLIIIMYSLIGYLMFLIMIMLILNLNNRVSQKWLLHILRVQVFLLTTILYMPSLDIFFKLIQCVEVNDIKVLKQFQQIQCWSHEHVVHGTMSIVGICLFLPLSIIYSLLYYENNYRPQLTYSKKSGRPMALILIYKFIMVICYTYMEDEIFDYFFVFIMTLGSITILHYNHVNKPFNNKYTQLLWSIILCINMWTVTLLGFALFFEDIFFFGLIYASISGIPFIIYYLLNVQRKDYEILMINPEKSTDPYMTIKFTDYVLELLSNDNQRNDLLLDGFIQMHKSLCSRSDCYILTKKDKPKSQKERNIDVVNLLAQIYFTQVKAHPNNIDLRIGYCKFLFDHIKIKQQIFNELNLLESLLPTLDQQFIIFRIKSLLSKENIDIQNQNQQNNDNASAQAFKLIQRSFQTLLERTTLLSMDFWSLLQEDNTNLTKLNSIGHRIFENLKQIDRLWSRMNQKSYYYPKVMRIYAKFLIEVLQDKDGGEQLMQKAKDLQTQINQQKDDKQINLIQEEDILFEPLPLAIISADSDKLGLILNANQSFSNLTGYFKNEILNRKINLLCPKYSKSTTIKLVDKEKFVMKDRLIFLKLKSNYIIPVTLSFKIISQKDEQIILASQFRFQKFIKSHCYFIIDEFDVIDSISSTCIPYMNVEQKSITSKKTSIKEIIKNFPKQPERSKYQQKGERVNFIIEGKISSIEHLQTQQDFHFFCQITEIKNFITQNLVKELKPPIKDYHQTFQIKFMPNKGIFQGQFENEGSLVKVDQSVLWEQGEMSFVSQQDQFFKQSTQTDQSDNKNQVNQYSNGIRTLRLLENRIQEIEENELSEDEEIENRTNVQKGDQKELIDEEDEYNQEHHNLLRSRSYLKGLMENEKQHSILTTFYCVTNLIILGVVTISFIDYFLTIDQYQQIERLLNILLVDNQRNAYIGMVISTIQNMVMINQNITYYPPIEAISVYQYQKQQLNLSITVLNQQINFLMTQNVKVNDQLTELYTQNVVKMQLSEDQFNFYDFFQANQQILSRAIIVYNKNLTDMTYNDRDVRFVVFNLQNGFLQASRNSCSIYAVGFKNTTIDKKITFTTLLGFAISIILLGYLIIVLLLNLIFDKQEEMLKIFLLVPEKSTRFMYKSSENFITSLQQGEDDDALSEQKEFEKQQTTNIKSQLGKKKKKYRISSKQLINQISTLSFLILILLAYFVFNFFMSQTLMDEISQQVNATTRAAAYYRFTDNAQRTLYLNRSWTILYQDSYEEIKFAIDTIYQIDSFIHQEHALNQGVTNPSYKRIFDQLFISNPCPYLIAYLDNISLNDCQTFAEGALQEGMAVGIARYFENVRYVQTIYDQFWGFPRANFTAIARNFTTFRNITQNSDNVTNFILNINGFNQSKESRIMQMNYIKALFEILLEEIVSGIDLNISEQISQRLALFIVFLAFMFILYFMFYLPLYMRLVKDLLQTRIMITIIPIKVIKKVRQIKLYIQEMFKNREID